MTNDPLLKWNQLNITNAEQNLASAMFASMISTSPIIDRFSTWLLAGTGATAALLIANASDLLPLLTEKGFKVCGVFLIVSGLLGFLAKHRAILCQIAYENDVKIREAMLPILEKHTQDEKKIIAHANQRCMQVNTELDMKNVLQEFSRPFPKIVRWLIARYLKKNKGNRQVGYIKPAKSYYKQCVLTVWQALTFMAFVISGIIYIKII
jgi:hypothetical protein